VESGSELPVDVSSLGRLNGCDGCWEVEGGDGDEGGLSRAGPAG
jgi:hypothetical protein